MHFCSLNFQNEYLEMNADTHYTATARYVSLNVQLARAGLLAQNVGNVREFDYYLQKNAILFPSVWSTVFGMFVHFG